MPRITAPDTINELRIDDVISGDIIALYYRLPTTEERTGYSRALFRRQRSKVVSCLAEARQRFGKKILAGFKEGDFVRMENGREVVYSSDDDSPLYDPNWKDLVCVYASDLVEFLAQTVFEGNTRDLDMEPEEDDAIEEISEKNS